MSLVPPAFFPTATVPYPGAYQEISDVTPFTYRSGATYQELLESIRVWLAGTLTDYLTQNFGSLSTQWQSDVQTVTTAVNTALAGQSASNATALSTTLAQIIAGSNTTLNNGTILAALQAASSTSLAFLDNRYSNSAPTPNGTDDTTNLQTWLNANAGKKLTLRAGTYYTTGITLPAGTYLSGSGTVLHAVSGATNQLITLNTGCRVETLEIDGTGSTGTSCDGIHTVQNVNRIVVKSCYIHNCNGTPIVYDHATDSEITDNIIAAIPNTNAVYVAFSNTVTIQDNTAITGGITVWGGDASVANFTPGCNRIFVVNNRFEQSGAFLSGVNDFQLNDNYSQNAGDVGMDAEGCWNGTISGNTVRNANNWPISIFYNCRDVSITGNSVWTDNTGLAGQKGGIGILTSTGNVRVAVTGNKINVPGVGIYTDNVALTDAVITGNFVYGGTYGILLQECTEVIVNGNQVRTAGTRGIGLEGSTFVEVHNNHVRLTGSDSSTPGANGGIWTYDKGDGINNASNCSIKHNQVVGFKSSISVHGVQTIIEGNTMDGPIYYRTDANSNDVVTNNRTLGTLAVLNPTSY